MEKFYLAILLLFQFGISLFNGHLLAEISCSKGEDDSELFPLLYLLIFSLSE